MAAGILFVFNPRSGKGTLKNRLFDIVDIFSQKGFVVTVYPTSKSGDGRKMVAKNGRKFKAVVISGGDGTLNECISGLLEIPEEKRPVVGYIPSGSTNDFAGSLKISKQLMPALETILSGCHRHLDAGRLNGESFVYIAAFGAFTDVAYCTPQNIKNYMGHMAYILEGIKRLPNLRSHVMRIEHGNEAIEGDFIFGMVTNSYFVGGMRAYKNWDVDLADGLFECVFVKAPQTPAQLQTIVAGLLTLDFSSESFCTFKAAEINITSAEYVDWTLDGEYGGSYSAVEIKNINRAYCILAKEE